MRKVIIFMLILSMTFLAGCSKDQMEAEDPHEFSGFWHSEDSEAIWGFEFQDDNHVRVGCLPNDGSDQLLEGDYTYSISDNRITMGDQKNGESAFTADFKCDPDEMQGEDFRYMELSDINWCGENFEYVLLAHYEDEDENRSFDDFLALAETYEFKDGSQGDAQSYVASGADAGETVSGRFSVDELINSSTPHIWAYIVGESNEFAPTNESIVEGTVLFFLTQNGEVTYFSNSSGVNTLDWKDEVCSASERNLLSAAQSGEIGPLNEKRSANLTSVVTRDKMSVEMAGEAGKVFSFNDFSKENTWSTLTANACFEGFARTETSKSSEGLYLFRALTIVAPDEETLTITIE